MAASVDDRNAVAAVVRGVFEGRGAMRIVEMALVVFRFYEKEHLKQQIFDSETSVPKA